MPAAGDRGSVREGRPGRSHRVERSSWPLAHGHGRQETQTAQPPGLGLVPAAGPPSSHSAEAFYSHTRRPFGLLLRARPAASSPQTAHPRTRTLSLVRGCAGRRTEGLSRPPDPGRQAPGGGSRVTDRRFPQDAAARGPHSGLSPHRGELLRSGAHGLSRPETQNQRLPARDPVQAPPPPAQHGTAFPVGDRLCALSGPVPGASQEPAGCQLSARGTQRSHQPEASVAA